MHRATSRVRVGSTEVRLAWAEVPPAEPRRDHAWRLLAQMLPAGAELDNTCPRCGGPHGPVVVRGAPFLASVTYAGSWTIAAVAATGDAGALGVDAELEVDSRRDAAGMAGLLEDDDATVRDWVRVESVLKADGRGLRVDPRSVAVMADAGGWTAVVPDEGVYDGSDAAGPGGVLVSVAVQPRGGRTDRAR
ncbi:MULTISPECIES: chemotaxis protein CheY [Microbacterium]|uniref:chemotaxis protein CheY n=1 Tax=Microbacterium TaxID=33882 RepID=UPI000D651738|nr:MULTISPECIES: chemotaxis protein CheY [Microbacterium]